LQLINFWQDVAVDLQKGRVYIPRDTLSRNGFDPAGEIPVAYDMRLRAALEFELDRARNLMLEGAPLARTLPGRIGWELALVVQGGLRIIEKIVFQDYDVFARRPVLGKADWLFMGLRAARLRFGGSVQ
jgi:phytoene synthase